MKPGIFKIEGQDYWDAPMKFSSQVLSEFVPQGRYGLFLDAPAEVDLARVDRVPLLVLHAVKQKEAHLYNASKAAHLVCMRLEDRSLEMIDLFEPPDEPNPFDDGAPPPAGEGAMASVDQTDALRCDAMTRPGHCVLTVLMLDRPSNRVEVHLSRSSDGYQDEAVAPFLETLRQALPPPEPVRPAPGQGRFTPGPRSPEPPASPGIALRCERVLLYEKGGAAWVRGALRVPALPRELVPPRPESGDDGQGEPRPVAIVQVWLVVIESREGTARTFPLRVPCFQDTSAEPGTEVVGFFEYDLFQHPEIADKARTNFIYGFCGEAMTGPVHMAVVTREMMLGLGG